MDQQVDFTQELRLWIGGMVLESLRLNKLAQLQADQLKALVGSPETSKDTA